MFVVDRIIAPKDFEMCQTAVKFNRQLIDSSYPRQGWFGLRFDKMFWGLFTSWPFWPRLLDLRVLNIRRRQDYCSWTFWNFSENCISRDLRLGLDISNYLLTILARALMLRPCLVWCCNDGALEWGFAEEEGTGGKLLATILGLTDILAVPDLPRP